MSFRPWPRAALIILGLIMFRPGLRAGQKMDLEAGLKILQATLSMGQEDYFRVWPGFDLRRIPIGLYTDESAWLVNHPTPGPPFIRTDRWLLQWRLYSSPYRPEDFYGNTSLRHNGLLTSILKVSEEMTQARFIELAFHEVFHTYQKMNPRLINRNGNVLLQPFFPEGDLDYYIMAFVEQMLLKDACFAKEDRESERFIQLYYTVLTERLKRTDFEFGEFEFEEQINEGLATYAGHLGLKMMGYEKEAREQFLKLLNTKTITPVGFRLRCYGTGRALAELLDRFDPGWKLDLSHTDTLVARLQRRIPPEPQGDARTILKLLMTPKLEEEFQWHLKAQEERREALKSEVMKPGRVTIRFVDGVALKNPRLRFDPLNVLRVGPDLLIHTRLLYLGKGERFDFRSENVPVINRVKPRDMLSIKEVIFLLPEEAAVTLDHQKVAGWPDTMTVGDMSIRSPSLQMRLRNAQIRRSENGPVILVR